MKFIVTVVEVTEKVIEVEANDYNELKRELADKFEDAGEVVKEPKTEELFCEIKDELNRNYPKINLIV